MITGLLVRFCRVGSGRGDGGFMGLLGLCDVRLFWGRGGMVGM